MDTKGYQGRFKDRYSELLILSTTIYSQTNLVWNFWKKEQNLIGINLSPLLFHVRYDIKQQDDNITIKS